MNNPLPPYDACGQEPVNSLEGFVSLWAGACICMLPGYCVPLRSGDEREDRMNGSCPLPRRSCQRVWTHQLWGGGGRAQLLNLVMLESKYVGIYFLVFVKTDHILSPTQTLKLPSGAGEMAQWVKCLYWISRTHVKTRHGNACLSLGTREAEPSGSWRPMTPSCWRQLLKPLNKIRDANQLSQALVLP